MIIYPLLSCLNLPGQVKLRVRQWPAVPPSLEVLAPPVYVLYDENAVPLGVPRHKGHWSVLRNDKCSTVVIGTNKPRGGLMTHSAKVLELTGVNLLPFGTWSDP